MSEYEVGKWYGWNGGECPVHPETVVEYVCLHDGLSTVDDDCAKWLTWGCGFEYPVVAFRIIKEHRDPVISHHEGKCHAYHYIGQEPVTASFAVGANSIHGVWTATHVDGKLQSFTWTAEE